VPFKWYPKDALLAQAAAWRMVDLSESNGESIDLVIATKFPTYFVRHPRKITWLFHQYRAIYDLFDTPYSEFAHTETDVRLRDRLIGLDNEVLGESTRLFSNARNTAARLARFNGLTAEPLYHPPPLAGKLTAGPWGDYVLSVGRLEGNKRVDLIVAALAHTDPAVRLIVVGEGPLRGQLETAASRAGVADRVTFTGAITERQLIDLYAGAFAVVFPPLDEDYGYVTLEAFLARKPVITTTDAGGPLEFVEDGITGLVCEPAPEALGAAIGRLAGDPRRAQSLGDAGYERARAISWDGVVDRLMAQD
jgi:glycosyltransferase involved in cell wall biosynthesis